MASRLVSTGSTRSDGLWPVIVLLLVAVAVPTAAVLWFMTEAMRNERLVVRQKLTAVYQSQLVALEHRLHGYWEEKQIALGSVDLDASAPEIFANLIEADLADSVIVYDAAGRVTYPAPANVHAAGEIVESTEWSQARRLEYQSADPAAAASAYARIAYETPDANLGARALQAQARCLVKAGRERDAVNILTGSFADSRFRQAADRQGSLIVPNAQLRALQLLADPSAKAYRTTLALLLQRITDYGDPGLASSQRRFLMDRLQAIVPENLEFPTLAAETLAAEYLEGNPPRSQASGIRPSGLSNVWRLASADGSVVAIFREDRIRADIQALIESEVSLPDATITLDPPEVRQPASAPFVTSSASSFLPSWRLAVRLTGSDPFTATAERHITTYLWSGVLVIAAIAILTGAVARYVGTQLRLARLKNDLLATVSHELKTPLSSIRALADTLCEGRYRDEEQHQEYLQLITKESERLSRLIDSFLAFSRMEQDKQTFEFVEVNIDTVVTTAVDALRDRFGTPNCRLDITIEPDLPSIAGDFDALVTVLVNLLDNAYKYSGDVKHVVVRAYANHHKIHLEVRDNGIGLSVRAAKKIFGRFYQVDQTLSREAGGCGLGLSIVKFIVTAHGGSVEVSSQPGEGSMFRVTLPAIAGLPLPPA